MPDVFINYRTGDEEAAATLIERELSLRFGSERIFRAAKSIAPGRPFPQELITAVRRSSVLLAVIGPHWLQARSADGGRALDSPGDWTRREILEAFESGALVIPVLVGKATRLERGALPAALKELADHQYRRLDLRNAEADLSRLADDLAELVPQLAATDAGRLPDHHTSEDDPAGGTAGSGREARMQTRDVRQQVRGGIGNLNGDLSGTFINEPQAPVHAGRGDQYNAPHFSSENMGVNYAEGDNSGSLRMRFDHGRRRQDDDR